MLRMLDVAIGILFLFTLLSVAASAAAEVWESILRRRARDLEVGLRRLLQDDALAEKFYDHPLILALWKDPPQKADSRKQLQARRPSYVPSRFAAVALLDLLSARSTADGAPLADVMGGVRTDVAAGRALASVLAAGGESPEQRLRGVEKWFDGAMGRVSSIYKRRTQNFLLAFGGLLAVTFNADAINLAGALAGDAALREQIVARASTWHPPAENKAQAHAGSQQLADSGLPIGWLSVPTSQDVRGVPQTWLEWACKIAGLAASALAVSLGAPFWFDVLNHFVQLRSSAKPNGIGERAKG